MKSNESGRGHRQKDDFRMREYFPVTFCHNSDTYDAQLTNLSMNGAHLLLKNHEPVRPILLVGAELLLNIRTPYGKSQCTAKVAWLAPEALPLSIGIAFTSLSEDPSDPLRCAIASPL
jgi:hypothetical protein